MNFYIKEWPDDTATLMTEGGRVVWTFASVEEAAEAARSGDGATQPRNRTAGETDWHSRRGAHGRIRRSAGRSGIVA